MTTLKILLTAWFKRSSKTAPKSGGFTLIELLVGLILAVLVITPLLGFMINILDTDRQEQAKTSSEQELQAAMDYITRDLQQAVYIYDKEGLAKITGNYAATTCTSDTATACSQLPASVNQTPVLVFWKRKFVEKSTPLLSSTDCTASPIPTSCQQNDAFVYSLVTYYLIKENNPNWSGAHRIGRFEIQDGVRKSDGSFVNETDPRVKKDKGFKLFDINQSGTLAAKMNDWKKAYGADEAYDKPVDVLIDYIDQSTVNVPSEACPTDSDTADTDPEWTQVPDYSNTTLSDAFKTSGFYSCVYSSKNTARVFLRGNAFARIRTRNNIPSYSNQASTFFPRARIEVKGSGALRDR